MWLTCPYCVGRERARIAKKFGKKRCPRCGSVHGPEGVPQEVMFRSRKSWRLCFLHHLEHELEQ